MKDLFNNPYISLFILLAVISISLLFNPQPQLTQTQIGNDYNEEIEKKQREAVDTRISDVEKLALSEELNKKISEKPTTLSELNDYIEEYKASHLLPIAQEYYEPDIIEPSIDLALPEPIAKKLEESQKIIGQVLADSIPADYDWAAKEAEVSAKRGPSLASSQPLGEQCGEEEILQDSTAGRCTTTLCGGNKENSVDGTGMGRCGTDSDCYESGFCYDICNCPSYPKCICPESSAMTCYERSCCIIQSCYGFCNADMGIAYLWDSITKTCCCGI